MHPNDELPVDCPIVFYSDDEFVSAEAFARFTSVGWGPLLTIAKTSEGLSTLLGDGVEASDIVAILYGDSAEQVGKLLASLTGQGVDVSQITIAGPPESLAHHLIAKALGTHFVPVTNKKTTLGPVIDLGGLVTSIKDQIYSRLAHLVDTEVRTARETGSLELLTRFGQKQSYEPIELATIASMIAIQATHSYSVRRRVIRASLFRGLLEIEDYGGIIRGARHLWQVDKVLSDTAIGLASVSTGSPAPIDLSLESWCLIAADAVLKDPPNALSLLNIALASASLEIRAVLKHAVENTSQQVRRWSNESAS